MGMVHALPSDPYELFKTMMGQRGEWEWRVLSQEQLWDIPHVQNSAGRPFNHYIKAIQYLKRDAINTIPKTIHFIWIGPKPFPSQSIANLISWKKHHPDWKIFFWTDDPERPLPIEGLTRRLITDFDFWPLQPYIEATHNWGEKADIMRYVIIYKEGGIYTDHDVECVRPFDPLTSRYDFAAGYAALHNYIYSLNSPFSPNNGIIIARPHHPILENTMKRLSTRWDQMTQEYVFNNLVEKVVARTFDPFTYCASQYIDIEGYRNVLLPASYLHSNGSLEAQIQQDLIDQGYVYAIHRFTGSWVDG
jgi:mannosyltransferase OCH1-like enzyme